MSRISEVKRATAETSIHMKLNLDGAGKIKGKTGIPFMDHMLELWVYHSGCDLQMEVRGDLEVDYHHTVEDLGICLGQCVMEALGDKSGINRYGQAFIPMDEALVMAVLDISGRPYINYNVHTRIPKAGDFDVELVEEFLRAFCSHSGTTLHVKLLEGKNTHHIVEAVFKAFARAFKEAVAVTNVGIPSTKGII